MKLMIKNITALMEQCGYIPIALCNETRLNELQYKEANDLLNCFCFLNARVQDILKLTEHSIDEILYSKYYWFTQYKDTVEGFLEENPELEQIQYQIFQQIGIELKGDVDWPLMQAIDENKPWLSPVLVKELQSD
ncbi:hypothetical protein [Feifania hominis]|uniref:Uncharacterized protein n=1 Tax=Feifania hominis TaxID=2763660 RepID=A0A926HVA6_9FIRM|nr:hypothetical protein [Feifania hominis]MBC8537138.1 hypothetical protein [Feifania hominis]